MAVSGLEQRYAPLILRETAWSPWGIGVLTPWSHEQDEEGEAAEQLLYATKTSKPTRKELRRSPSWAGFATWMQKARHNQFLEQYPYPMTKVSATDADTEKLKHRKLSVTDSEATRYDCKASTMSDMTSSETDSSNDPIGLICRDQPKSSHVANKLAPPDRDTATTLAIRNLPHNVTPEELWLAVDASGFAGLYDFEYSPSKFKEHRNQAFAFINFANETVAQQFHAMWHKSLDITWASRRPSTVSTTMSDMTSSETDNTTDPIGLLCREQPKSSHVANELAPLDRDTATTLAIRNLPYNVTREELLLAVDASGFAGLYDFAYLPSKFKEHRNQGFAFINFANVNVAQEFHAMWHKSRRLKIKGPFKNIKPLNVSVATVQGVAANGFMANSQRKDALDNSLF